MGFLNFNYGILNYEDQSANNPTVRNMDISQSFQSLNANHENSAKHTIAPGQSLTIAATTRALASGGSTVWSVSRPVEADSTMRLGWTSGAAPQFRAARSLGISPATQVSIVRSGPAAARLTISSGSTALVQTGDVVKFFRNTDAFTSPFSSQNAGQSFVVQAVGTGYIDFLDNGSAAEEGPLTGCNLAFCVMSNGPVQVGDTLWVAGSVNQSNKGEWKISDVGPDFVEFLNPFGVVESFTGQTVAVYDHLIQFVHVSASAPVSLSFDGEGDVRVGRLGHSGPVLFMGTANAYRIDASNKGQEPITVTIRHMAVDG